MPNRFTPGCYCCEPCDGRARFFLTGCGGCGNAYGYIVEPDHTFHVVITDLDTDTVVYDDTTPQDAYVFVDTIGGHNYHFHADKSRYATLDFDFTAGCGDYN